MALIACVECGHRVSDQAARCPSCGHSKGKHLNKSKMAAFSLAFFLGSFGLHKFYLGNMSAGWIYLLFCWTGIPTILGLIDSLFILFKNQSEFSGNVSYAKAKPFKPSDKIF